jgi:hypothetical protein
MTEKFRMKTEWLRKSLLNSLSGIAIANGIIDTNLTLGLMIRLMINPTNKQSAELKNLCGTMNAYSPPKAYPFQS